jgi:plastocyanin
MIDRSRRPRVVRLALLAAAGTALVLAPASNAAPPTPAVAISPPQGSTAGFATVQVVALQGQAVQLFNADSIVHTLQSKATRPVKVRYAGKSYTVQVPLFDSGPVAGASAGDVKGVLHLKPGSYEFLCGLHTNMKGTLVIQASPVTAAKGR